MKFKSGDKVTIISEPDDEDDVFFVGKTGTICEIYYDLDMPPYDVLVLDGHEKTIVWCHDENLVYAEDPNDILKKLLLL